MSEALTSEVEKRAAALPAVFAEFKEQAMTLLKSGLLPAKFNGKPEAVVITMLYGKELGLAPMQAVKEIHVINNVPSISANLMLTLVRQRLAGFQLEVMEASPKISKIRHRRTKADEWQISTYTIEEAATAKLLGKDNWKNHPADMLFARNVSRVCRWNYSDVLAGFVHTPEELEGVVGRVEAATDERLKGEIHDEKKPDPLAAKARENDSVDEEAIIDLVGTFLEPDVTESDLERLHNNFADKHKDSPATVGAAYDAYHNQLRRLQAAKQ